MGDDIGASAPGNPCCVVRRQDVRRIARVQVLQIDKIVVDEQL